MYGQEIARVKAHDNGYTVETKTKPRPKVANGKGGKMSSPVSYPSDSGEAMPDNDWESSVATSKKEMLERVAAAHEAHQDSLLKQKLKGSK